MTGFWWCMTPIIWIIGAAIVLDRGTKDYGVSLISSLIFFVPFWWAIYWLWNWAA